MKNNMALIKSIICSYRERYHYSTRMNGSDCSGQSHVLYIHAWHCKHTKYEHHSKAPRKMCWLIWGCQYFSTPHVMSCHFCLSDVQQTEQECSFYILLSYIFTNPLSGLCHKMTNLALWTTIHAERHREQSMTWWVDTFHDFMCGNCPHHNMRRTVHVTMGGPLSMT
jgi:hypothetical protein